MSAHLFDDAGFLASVALIGSTIITGAVWLLRKGSKIIRRVGNFLDDFNGVPARDGVPAVPGVMVRLQKLDECQTELMDDRAEVKRALATTDVKVDREFAAISKRLDSMEPQVSEIHHEIKPNDGASMKDQLTRVDKTLNPRTND